jgi:hypothetical protein
MRITGAITVSVCLVCMSLSTAGKAQEKPESNRTRNGQTTKSSKAVDVFNYGRLDKACAEWTDGCRVCSQAGCSNIGIACQPKEEISCTDRPPSLGNKPRQ